MMLFLSVCDAEFVILKTEGVVAYDLVLKGLNQSCNEKNVTLNLKKDLSNEAQILDQLKNLAPSFFILLGDEAADFASRNIKNKDLLYSMVLQAKKYNFNKHSTLGLDVLINIDQIFMYLKQINKEYKNIGVIYGIGEGEVLNQYAEEIAKKENVNIIAKGIKGAQEVVTTINELLPQVQVVLIIPSNVTVAPEVVTYIHQKALEKQIPVVGLAEVYLQYGALFTISINPLIVGGALGTAACLLTKGEVIANMRVSNLSYSNVSLNLKVAELLKLTIPNKMKESAFKTIK